MLKCKTRTCSRNVRTEMKNFCFQKNLETHTKQKFLPSGKYNKIVVIQLELRDSDKKTGNTNEEDSHSIVQVRKCL